MLENSETIELEHHKQQPLCTTRALYRQGRKLTAVKVYTVNNESNHILIYGVPKINLRSELKSLCMKYGKIKLMALMSHLKAEIFTECYRVTFERIQSARIAKRFLDTKSFYGGVLHVCYGPEYESIQETRSKLRQRQKDVAFRLQRIEREETNARDHTANIPEFDVSEESTTTRTYQQDFNAVKINEVSEISDTKISYKDVFKNKNRKRKHPAIMISEDRLKNVNQDVWKGIPPEIDPRNNKNDNDRNPTKKNYTIKKHFEIKNQNIFNKNKPIYGPSLGVHDNSVKSDISDKPKVLNVPNSNSSINWNTNTSKKIVFLINKKTL